jgi:hypothetical protein
MLGRENRITADLHCLLTALADTAHDHIIDSRRINPTTLNNCIKRFGSKINGVNTGKAPTTPSTRCTYCIDNIGCGHSIGPLVC